MDEISILLKQNRLASYLRSIVGSNCSIGLHEINDCYHKREKAQHIMTSVHRMQEMHKQDMLSFSC